MRQTGRPIDVPVAVATWVAAFVAGQVLSLAIVATSGQTDQDLIPIPTLFAAVAATWLAFLVGMYVASKRSGTGDLRADVGMRVRPIDIIGLPIGVLTQLVLVPLVYLPLRQIWPATFADKKLSETADKLADRASGGSMVLLVLMVVRRRADRRGDRLPGVPAALVLGAHLAGGRVARRGGLVRAHPLPARRVSRACSCSPSSPARA